MNTAVGNILRNFFVLVEIANLSEISKRLLLFEKKKKSHTGNQTDLLKDCYCLFVCLSVANISSSSTGLGGLKELESLSSHTLGLEVQVLQASKVLTVRPPQSWAGNGNSASEGISATKKLHILPNWN